MIVDCLLHAHSTFSYDSPTPLVGIAGLARAQGIGCVLMSEHNNTLNDTAVSAFVGQCDELSRDGLLMVPGLELSYDENRVHLLAYGVRRFIPSIGPGFKFGDLAREIHRERGVAVLAHPSHKGAFARVPPADFTGLDAMEVWNVRNGNRFCPDGRELGWLNAMRGGGQALWGLCGVDLHSLNRFARVVARVEISELSAPAVLESLRMGRFTISGPHLDLPPYGEGRLARLAVFMAVGRTLTGTRRFAYRWQGRIERLGIRVPRPIASLWRRVF